VPPGRVVPALDKAEDGHSGLCLRAEPAPCQQLALERREAAIVTIGNTAWCALMNRKTRTLSSRSPVRTRPPLFCQDLALLTQLAVLTRRRANSPAPPPVAHHRGGQHHVRLGAPNSRSLAPSARTRVTAPPAFVLIAPARPSGTEIPARMAGDSSAPQHLLLKWKGVHETEVNSTRKPELLLHGMLEGAILASHHRESGESLRGIREAAKSAPTDEEAAGGGPYGEHGHIRDSVCVRP
jgi:hypothetical protein